jgi:hypothetical protein
MCIIAIFKEHCYTMLYVCALFSFIPLSFDHFDHIVSKWHTLTDRTSTDENFDYRENMLYIVSHFNHLLSVLSILMLSFAVNHYEHKNGNHVKS